MTTIEGSVTAQFVERDGEAAADRVEFDVELRLEVAAGVVMTSKLAMVATWIGMS